MSYAESDAVVAADALRRSATQGEVQGMALGASDTGRRMLAKVSAQRRVAEDLEARGFVLRVTKMGNAAISEDPEGELSRMLRQVADVVEDGATEGPLLDRNGNRVGWWRR